MNGYKIDYIKSLQRQILALDRIQSGAEFDQLAILIFQYQVEHNPIYKSFVHLLGIDPNQVQRLDEIPLLPISAFKYHNIQSGEWAPQATFLSSGTTAQKRSKHLMSDLEFYQKVSASCFESILGKSIRNTSFLALLPSYLEQGQSSLVAMVDAFMRRSKYSSAFYLSDFPGLYQQLIHHRDEQIPTVLFGVSYALLDFVEDYKVDFPELVIIETGGMKGRGEELVREELHRRLRVGFNGILSSEYGMTEMMSQAYMVDDLFQAGPSLRILVRDRDDPLSSARPGKSGLIGLIDLGNVQTCSFVLTEDLGLEHSPRGFEVLGRADYSEWRGCNLMLADIGV